MKKLSMNCFFFSFMKNYSRGFFNLLLLYFKLNSAFYKAFQSIQKFNMNVVKLFANVSINFDLRDTGKIY